MLVAVILRGFSADVSLVLLKRDFTMQEGMFYSPGRELFRVVMKFIKASRSFSDMMIKLFRLVGEIFESQK